MERPLISVIIPVYNVEKYLPKCMESVMAQTYKNLEILVIDDGSNKVCAAQCDTYPHSDSRVKVYHKENGGPSDARNFGIDHAGGEYLTFIDSDDYVDVDYVEYLFSTMMKYNTMMAMCQHRLRYPNGRIEELGSRGDEALSTRDCLERIMYGDYVYPFAWGCLYHHALFDTVRYPMGKLFEDIGTTYQIVLQCKMISIGYESKYNYIIRDDSITQGIFTRKKFDHIEMNDKMAHDVIEKYPEMKQAAIRFKVLARLSTLNRMIGISGFEAERREMIQYIKQNRWSVLFNRKAPARDKIAIILISISYEIYKKSWLLYLKYKKGISS